MKHLMGGRVDSWHAALRWSLGFALRKTARPPALFTRPPGSGADQILALCFVHVSSPETETRSESDYQAFLESQKRGLFLVFSM